MGATPVAAVLAGKGLSPGVVLAALVIGSVLHFRVMHFWAAAYGGRSTLVATLAVIAVAWAGALSFDAMPVTVKTDRVEALPLGWGSYLGTALLGVLVLRAVWREGLGRWLGSLGGAAHTHAHAHRHGG
jgi:branched-subunit amino acid ABC-type transport system permease component